ncbi:tetratricopeptide repeat-containing diguanylate cyclase [Vibrio olivae]|uniref:Tetratricopeptide repeat protein n=1 Tax=Vibrio olivae TaxID=1243002 RepID=A0ABV5HGX2_9VIBR
MLPFRWIFIILWCALSVTHAARAAILYSSPVLNEAAGLLDIVPEQSKQLASSYLTQRTLTAKEEKSPSSVGREDTDSRIRTPGGTVEALQILAQAEYNLDNHKIAMQRLEQAEQLSSRHTLPFQHLRTRLLMIRLRWLDDHNSRQAQKSLVSVEQEFRQIENTEQLAKGIQYQMSMLAAEIASYDNDILAADRLYAAQADYISHVQSPSIIIDYHTAIGRHLLNHKLYNKALSELLLAYWSAIEENASAELAKVNQLLAQLFYERKVLDKSLDHLLQAADFYDNYEKSPALPHVLKLMGDVYYHQGKYNLALVHYFNVIDHEDERSDIRNVIDIRLSLAKTYLHLYNIPLAEQYLNRANELLAVAHFPELKAEALLLESGLAYNQKLSSQAISSAQHALDIATEEKDVGLQQNAYRLLYLAYEQAGQYDKALSNIEQYNALATIEQRQLNLISEDAFRQQKEFIEQRLHLTAQQKQLDKVSSDFQKFQKVSFVLFIGGTLFFLLMLRRGQLLKDSQESIDALTSRLFTHSRSGLNNLRMLNIKLPQSLEQSSDKFERWHIGELINEPLNDRLQFAMIDVPFMRNIYLKHGYEEGLKLEKAFGDYMKEHIEEPARIYHFSDSNFLYIEPNTDRDRDPAQLVDKIQKWIEDFLPQRNLDRIIRVGIADYPFLPRAYTAINDRELLDILLMATSAARTLAMQEQTSQWVYLKAIENAPAASLATGNIRKACKHSLSQGLIKVHSSFQNEETLKKLLKDD